MQKDVFCHTFFCKFCFFVVDFERIIYLLVKKVLEMATLLLVVIYIVFIGLGLPDSSIGAAWPALYPDLGLDVGMQSLLSAIVSSGTVLASLFSAKLINKFGTNIVTSFSTLLTAIALLGFSLSNSIWYLIALAIPLGFGAGAIDAALNNYVATRYSSFAMGCLHCFYGVGVALSPYIFSLALFQNNDWRLGFKVIFIIQIAISVVSFASIPLWKKVREKEPEKNDFTPVTLSLKQMAKMRPIRIAWILFFSTCALEFLCGTWGCTFLVQTKGVTESKAAELITLYYVGMTVGRFLAGLISSKVSCGGVLSIGFSLVAVGIIALFLPLPPWAFGIAFCLIGLGNGPTFPNLTHATPFVYGRERSQSIIGTQMAACNLGIMFMYVVTGPLFQGISLKVFPYFAVISYAVMVGAFVVYQRLIKKDGKSFFNLH